MADSPTDIEVTMILCDSAQSVGNKLYILGGGWSQIAVPPGTPLAMALALKISVPWSRSNEKIPVKAVLVTENGEPVHPEGAPEPIEIVTEVEVGRPTGLPHGTPLDVSMALNLQGLPLAAGGYVWELHVDDGVPARTSFRVHDA